MTICVASGKGGTGKTTIAVNLALSLSGVQLLDCDVEEPNSYIFIKPQIKNRKVVSVPIPQVDESKCNFCGRCREVCAFGAIAVIKDKVLIFEHLCHGCGACQFFCPQDAIKETNKEIGVIEIGERGDLQFIGGRLNIGEAIPTPVIKEVKRYINPARINIIDASPGTSCSVVEAVRGVDFCILVTEPTPFGLNDLVLTIELLREFKINFGVVINRSDLGDREVEDYCCRENIPVFMKIPFRKEIAVAYSKGIPLVDAFPEYRVQFQELFGKIKKLVV